VWELCFLKREDGSGLGWLLATGRAPERPPLQETGIGKEAYRNAATVARVLFSTRVLSLVEVVPMGWPL
jgi:hypothetical protein